MPPDPTTFAAHLTPHPNGYWIADSNAKLSYPAEGNDACFAIEDASFWFRHRNQIITETLRQFPPAGTFFDIGGGNGYVAQATEKAGFPTILIEPGPAGAANAVRRGLANVICATVEAAGFKPGSLPAAGMFDVLEHIKDDHAFLANLHSLLQPGGRVYLTVPALRSLWSVEDDHAGHFRRYTKKTLSRTLKSAGFTVEYITYFFWILPLPVLMLRTLPSLIGLRRTVTENKSRREHSTGGGLAARLLNIELSRIRQKKPIPCGTSCLAVARKEL